MGGTHAPAGVVGEGTLASTPSGLRLNASVESRGLMNGLGCLGAILGFVSVALMIGFLREAHVPDVVGKVFGGLLFFGPLLGGFALGKKLSGARPLSVELAWKRVRNAHLEAGLLVFDTKAKPKGRVWFRVAPGDAASIEYLLREITDAAK